jgi:hypothetical protein
LYPNAKGIHLGGSLKANNVPLDARLFTTGDDIAAVMAFYRQEIGKRGLKTVEHRFGQGAGYVAFYDKDSGTMRVATVYPAGEKTTLIVLSSMDPRPMLGQRMQIPADVPSIPEAINVTVMETSEGSSRSRSISFEIPSGTPGEARQKLKASGEALGWKPAKEQEPFGKDALVLQRGPETCVIRIGQQLPGVQLPRGSSVIMMVFSAQ